MEATITSKGQITLPKPLRDTLQLSQGDRVAFFVDEDGSVRLIPKRQSIRQLKGVLAPPPTAVSLEDMDRAISRGARRGLGPDNDGP